MKNHRRLREAFEAMGRRPLHLIRSLRVALLAPCVLALGCGTTPKPPPPIGSYAAYRVGAPDQLLVTILPEPVIERRVVVRPDGMITIDLVGDVPAGGRTVEEIAADIEQRISRYKRDASATVAVENAQSRAVTVLGEVRRPSTFPLLKDTRVAEAIGTVGGVTSWGFAATGRIRVIRTEGGETDVFKIDLDAIRRGDLSTNILLTKGDVVYVPPTLWARVGYVMQAVMFPFQPLLGVATSVAGNLVTP